MIVHSRSGNFCLTFDSGIAFGNDCLDSYFLTNIIASSSLGSPVRSLKDAKADAAEIAAAVAQLQSAKDEIEKLVCVLIVALGPDGIFWSVTCVHFGCSMHACPCAIVR
jgi:hypothetical protein